MLVKILGVGITTVLINLILKQYKPEFCLLVNVCGGLVIFLLAMSEGQKLIQEFIGIENQVGVNLDIVSPILKVVGIGYITEFTSDLAEDFGNKSISNKVVLGGKIAICISALPIIKKLINAIILLI